MTQKMTAKPGTAQPPNPRSGQSATPAKPEANGPNSAKCTRFSTLAATHDYYICLFERYIMDSFDLGVPLRAELQDPFG